MNADILSSLSLVTRSVGESPTLPPACYTDPAVQALEQETVLRSSWVGIGRADRWREPGDYAALTVAGSPIIVVRDSKGDLRAFANSCRHRGTQLVEGEGNTPRFVCPFHGWAYGLDGTLRGATRMQHGAPFELDAFPLIGYRTAEYQGFAFVALDAAVADISEWLGNFDAVHRPWPLETLVTTRRRDLEVAS